jgi:hypothetical protein
MTTLAHVVGMPAWDMRLNGRRTFARWRQQFNGPLPVRRLDRLVEAL